MTGRPRYEPEAFGKPGSAGYQLGVEILTLLRGNVNMHDHMKHFAKSATAAGTADTEFTVDITSLGLTFTPIYVMTLETDNGGMVYASSKGSWSPTSIKLKCTKASSNVVIGVF